MLRLIDMASASTHGEVREKAGLDDQEHENLAADMGPLSACAPSCSIMTLGCDFQITQLVDSNLGYHFCCSKVRPVLVQPCHRDTVLELCA